VLNLGGLLDLSRLESGTVNVNWQAIYLQDIFSAIHAHESTAAGRKGLRLSFRPTTALVMTDPMLLERSVRNLVSNAIRYTERGGVLVGVRRRAGGQRLLIEVWDTGIGIPTTDQAAIFDEFVQLGDVPPPQGLGLGLAIIRRSIDMLGYRLALRSVPGRGSCFRIELPALTDRTAQPLARMKEEDRG
jgi:signal transduction histidine kinase